MIHYKRDIAGGKKDLAGGEREGTKSFIIHRITTFFFYRKPGYNTLIRLFSYSTETNTTPIKEADTGTPFAVSRILKTVPLVLRWSIDKDVVTKLWSSNMTYHTFSHKNKGQNVRRQALLSAFRALKRQHRLGLWCTHTHRCRTDLPVDTHSPGIIPLLKCGFFSFSFFLLLSFRLHRFVVGRYFFFFSKFKSGWMYFWRFGVFGRIVRGAGIISARTVSATSQNVRFRQVK